jgi:hypothetical protein
MTTSDFDPRLLDLYDKPKHLLHFQWQNNSNVYRYALVEIIDQGKINHRSKQKDDEKGLTQKQIWEIKYA